VITHDALAKALGSPWTAPTHAAQPVPVQAFCKLPCDRELQVGCFKDSVLVRVQRNLPPILTVQGYVLHPTEDLHTSVWKADPQLGNLQENDHAAMVAVRDSLVRVKQRLTELFSEISTVFENVDQTYRGNRTP
jgi:hypothetical protein